jgi:hypothetical protein
MIAMTMLPDMVVVLWEGCGGGGGYWLWGLVESLVRTCGDLFMRETCFLLYSSGRAELVSYGISFECRLSMN